MIIESMSDAEIHAEVKSEQQEAFEYVQKFIPNYRRLVIKSSKFPIYIPSIPYLSKRKNNYLIFLRFKEKKKWNNPTISIICVYDKEGGKNAIQYGTLSDTIYIYSPHFFSRYRTRFLKDETMGAIDVIKRYFKINSALTRRLENETNEFIATSTEGIILGKGNENIYLAKTFISEDIMYKDQLDLKDRWLPYLKKYKGEI